MGLIGQIGRLGMLEIKIRIRLATPLRIRVGQIEGVTHRDPS
jgi:hypothetical protein